MKYLRYFENYVTDVTGRIYYHGSNNKFEQFELVNNKGYKEFDLPVWYFTEDIEYAKPYGKYLYSVKLNVNNTLDISNSLHYKIFIDYIENEYSNDEDKIDEILDEQFYNGLPYWTCVDIYYCAISNGFDSVLIQEGLEDEVLSIAVFNVDVIEIVDISIT
jgi:hypothetical protein